MVDAAHGEEAEEQAGQEECSVGGDHMVDVWLEFGSADSGLHGCIFLSSSGVRGGVECWHIVTFDEYLCNRCKN